MTKHVDYEEDEGEVECLDCGWLGYVEELVALTDDLDDEDFSHCPRCEGKNVVDWAKVWRTGNE